MDINEIKKFLPHRYPFLLVDRVLECDNVRLVAIKNVTVNEPFFPGHFPSRPVMPGVIIVEALAQACAILASRGLSEGASDNRIYYFTGIDKARFKRPVVPGDQILMTVEVQRRIKNMWKCGGTATVDGQTCCTAELMFTYKDMG